MSIRGLKASLVLAGMMTTAPAWAGPTFSDTTFTPSNYTLTSYYTAPTAVTFGQAAVGNPAPGLQATFSSTGTNLNGELFAAINNTFVYNPGTNGAIGSISASLDRYYNLFDNGLQTTVTSYTLRVLAQQDGKTYQAIFTTPSSQTGGFWITLSQANIQASDFKLFDPANYTAAGTQTGLNYAGDPITFGFAMRAGNLVDSTGAPVADPASGDLRADNFFLTINPAAPEPASWALMIVGFGLIGGVLRRRQRPGMALTA